MKNLIVFFGFIFCLFSCGTSNDEGAVIEDNPAIEKNPVIEETTTKVEKRVEEVKKEKGQQFAYEGEIEGGIPILISFTKIGNVLKGEIVYKKVGTPIPVIGTVEDDKYFRILEFSDKGEVTGILSGDFINESKDLSWFSPTKRTTLKMELDLMQTMETDETFNGGDVEGKYRYYYGENGHKGRLEVKRVGKDSVEYSLLCTTQAPAYNMADTGGESILEGNKISYSSNTDKYDDCAYDIHFYKDFVHIEYVDDRTECGFGHNAYVSGIFRRVKE